MDRCLTRELNISSEDLSAHEKAPHWNSKLVSRVMKLAFSSSSVKLQATDNGQQEEIELNFELTGDQKISAFLQQPRSLGRIRCLGTSHELVLLSQSDRIVSSLVQ
jgi:hypothetical protein